MRHVPALQLKRDKIHGPFPFLNPTQAHFAHVSTNKSSAESEASDENERVTAQTSNGATDRATARTSDGANDSHPEEVPASSVEYKWTSRNNRKGRHALVVTPADSAYAQYATPPPTSATKEVMKGIWRMFTYYPFWDISWLVAQIFTWGSVIWVVNAFFALLPFTNAETDFPGETLFGGGITAFIGATVFEIGSVFLMLEAVNENRAGCFGWALEQVYDEHFGHAATERGIARVVPEACSHHHSNKKNLVGKAPSGATATAVEKQPDARVSADGTPPGGKSWVWWPSWRELRTHYFHDLGFIACSCQMFGATVFWISGFTALPGIYDNLAPIAVLNGVYWVPQMVGGMFFTLSGALFTIETQKHWWQPAFGVLGWHIGLWNFIGGVGFLLCPVFGLKTSHWREMQASISTFWGTLSSDLVVDHSLLLTLQQAPGRS